MLAVGAVKVKHLSLMLFIFLLLFVFLWRRKSPPIAGTFTNVTSNADLQHVLVFHRVPKTGSQMIQVRA